MGWVSLNQAGIGNIPAQPVAGYPRAEDAPGHPCVSPASWGSGPRGARHGVGGWWGDGRVGERMGRLMVGVGLWPGGLVARGVCGQGGLWLRRSLCPG